MSSAPYAACRIAAAELLDVAKRYHQKPVIGGLLQEQDGVLHVTYLIVLVDLAGTLGFRDLFDRPVQGKDAHGIELTIAEARALAA